MKTAKIFRNGRSQAVRLPKEFQFSTDEVYINKVGSVVILVPCEQAWKAMAESLKLFTDDFMAERDQGGPVEERKPL